MRMYLTVTAVLLFSTLAHAQRFADNYTKQSTEFYFTELAKRGKELTLPPLELTAGSRIGYLGELRPKGVEFDAIVYKVVQHIPEGTLFDVLYYRSPRQVKVTSNRFETYPAQRFEFGPFLLLSGDYREIPTDGVFTPSGLWQISESFEYATVAGSTRTVLAIRRLPDDAIKIPEHPELLTQEPRDWYRKNGEFLAAAVYHGYDRGKVTIIKIGGDETTVAIGELSQNDQSWVRAKIKERRAAENASESSAIAR